MSYVYRIVGGLVLLAIGVAFVAKTEWFLRTFGRVDWAERKLGDSRLFYKLIGLVFCFLGLMSMTGLLGSFVLGTAGRLFRPPT